MSSFATFGDIHQLLVGLGFERQSTDQFVAYVLPSDNRRLFMFPVAADGEAAGGNHVADVRHHLIAWGFLDQESYDRWLCKVRFGEVCRERPAAMAAAVAG